MDHIIFCFIYKRKSHIYETQQAIHKEEQQKQGK